MCADAWYNYCDEAEINGECPDCGEKTVDGEAAEGCNYGRDKCETCGGSPCSRYC